MTLVEIRDKFLSGKLKPVAAYYALFDTGMSRPRCIELLGLWILDELAKLAWNGSGGLRQ